MLRYHRTALCISFLAMAMGEHPIIAAPTAVGVQIAGTFSDASGHSAQSHLVYAAQAGVWWLFTLTSAADSIGGADHIVKADRASTSHPATATRAAAAPRPGGAGAAAA